MQLRKATRQKAKIRLGLSAPSGGGKTFSAILIGKGLAGGDLSKVAIIDTENGSADLYAHLGEYNVLPLLPPYAPERYIEAIHACENAGMGVIIIDSITHEWDGEGGVLRIADGMTGDFTKWKLLTPRHQAFIDAILKSSCHIITTVRRKQEYALVDGANGKKTVEKLGLKEITREGFDYELTVNLELDTKHNAFASKDRTGLFMDKPHFTPSEETGRIIAEWCENGEDVNVQVADAINKLATCHTQDEVLLLKETLPLLVVNHADFKNAGNARYAALKPTVPVEQTESADTTQTDEAGNQTAGSAPAIASTETPQEDHQPVPVETPKEEPLTTATIQACTTPDELAEVLKRINELPDGERKPLRTSTTLKAKKEGWISNPNTKRFEAAPATPATGEPLSNNALIVDQGHKDAALRQQFKDAPSREALFKVYKANQAQILASSELSADYQARREELKPIDEAAILEIITKAMVQAELTELAAHRNLAIEESAELTKAFAAKVTALKDAPLAREVAKAQNLEWFKERIGKAVWAESTEGGSAYMIEGPEWPAFCISDLQPQGYTFRDATPEEIAAAKEQAA